MTHMCFFVLDWLFMTWAASIAATNLLSSLCRYSQPLFPRRFFFTSPHVTTTRPTP